MEALPSEQRERKIGPHGEWLERHQDVVTVGFTRRVIDQLGQVVHVQLPKVQTLLAKGDIAVVVESSKAATDCETPVGGTVVAANLSLYNVPDILNESPESAGWLYRLNGVSEQEWQALGALNLT